MKAVSKSFGAVRVLDRLDLQIRRGEKVVIIGRSGSGKTTLLRILVMLEQADSGIVEIDGEVVTGDVRHRRKIRRALGMVFQQFNLFPHMTVLANIIEAPVRVLGENSTDAKKRAMELLELVGLTDKANAYPRQLSGGQQQRVAIARALAMRPKIMLFDEITSSLDPELVGEVLQVIRKIAAESNMTMLVVTHEMGFGRQIADRVIFIEEGSIVESGPPSLIFERPSEERTRAFLRAVLHPLGDV
jgi:polar amino acid transport system ATP-binding protein